MPPAVRASIRSANAIDYELYDYAMRHSQRLFSIALGDSGEQETTGVEAPKEAEGRAQLAPVFR